jgi:hypothetical protein
MGLTRIRPGPGMPGLHRPFVLVGLLGLQTKWRSNMAKARKKGPATTRSLEQELDAAREAAGHTEIGSSARVNALKRWVDAAAEVVGARQAILHGGSPKRVTKGPAPEPFHPHPDLVGGEDRSDAVEGGGVFARPRVKR